LGGKKIEIIGKLPESLPEDEQRDFLYSLIDTIPKEVMLTGEDGRIVFANRACIRGIGLSKEYILGRHITEVYDMNMGPRKWKKDVFDKLRGKKYIIRYIFNRNVNKKRHKMMEFCASYFKYKCREYILSIVWEISTKMQIEQISRESEKMKALQQLIAGTTHEIQYPLKALLERLDTLVKKYKHRDFEYIGYKEFKDIIVTLERMRDQARYCFDTTERLLSINKRKLGIKNKNCHVVSIIKDVVNELKHDLELANIKLKLKLTGDVPRVGIGSIELKQVLTNIITNSLQSMPTTGGQICLKANACLDKDMVLVECKDNGIGISKENLPRVFEPFYTTKQRGLDKNSGLGLSIVYSIIKACNGEISIKSDLKKGTVVRLMLPVYKK